MQYKGYRPIKLSKNIDPYKQTNIIDEEALKIEPKTFYKSEANKKVWQRERSIRGTYCSNRKHNPSSSKNIKSQQKLSLYHKEYTI